MSSPGPASIPSPQVVFEEIGTSMQLGGAGLDLEARGGSVVCGYSFVDTNAHMMGVEVKFPEHYIDPNGKLRIFDHVVFVGENTPSGFDGSQPQNFAVCIWPGKGDMYVTAHYRLDESEKDEKDKFFGVTLLAVVSSGAQSLIGAGVYKGGSVCGISVEVKKGYRFKYWQSNSGEVNRNQSFEFVVHNDVLWVAYIEPIKRTGLVVHDPARDCRVVEDESQGGNIVRDE